MKRNLDFVLTHLRTQRHPKGTKVDTHKLIAQLVGMSDVCCYL